MFLLHWYSTLASLHLFGWQTVPGLIPVFISLHSRSKEFKREFKRHCVEIEADAQGRYSVVE